MPLFPVGSRLLHRAARRLAAVAITALTGVLTGALAACGGPDQAPAGTGRALPPLSTPRRIGPGDPSCPRNSRWQPCGFEDRIFHAGLSIKATGDSARLAFLPVPGVRYRVALTDTILAFFFKDSIALQKALAPLDTVRVAPVADTTLPWPRRPVVIRSGNLLALYFSATPRQRERITLAITAGAPAPQQPAPPPP
ncbi:MAG: hypothetical protein WCK74_12375 [Gemmatimonadaceae bacterium]